MGRPVVHFEAGGKDARKLAAFYARQFGWKIQMFPTGPTEYGLVQTGSKKGINGGISGTPPGTNSWITFYIEVPSIDPVLAKIRKSGGKVILPRTVMPGMVTLAHFADPAGNVVGLVESRVPPAPKPPKKAKKTKKKPAKKRTAKKRAAKRTAKR